jgi:N-acetylmuramoyl-L-alanine amidase
MKICIDAGHGGSDPGAIGTEPFHLEEKDFNLNLAETLEGQLESRGHWVVMTRRKDRYVSLPARANFANRLEAEFFVSIHANAAESYLADGMEVFYFPGSQAGRNAATTVLNSMIESFPDHRNRGVKSANFTVLRLTNMPAILVESEFLTNPDQLQFLANMENQQNLATAIADGIDALT